MKRVLNHRWKWLVLFFFIMSITVFGVITYRVRYESFVVASEIEASDFFDASRMREMDLIARGAKSPEGYKARYLNSIIPFTEPQNMKLEKLTRIINKQYFAQTSVLKWIPWKFAKITSDIELGYPHTLGDTIILSDSFFTSNDNQLTSTLIHEQIHVFQRKYPELTSRFAAEVLEFVDVTSTVAEDAQFQQLLQRSRNNPDISQVYAWKGEWIPLQVYRSANPANISESKLVAYNIHSKKEVDGEIFHNAFPSYVNQKEHPYEIMAVVIPRSLMTKSSERDDLLEHVYAWVLKNM